MKRTLVIYCSNTGFTEKYARWIAGAVGAEVVSLAEASPALVSDYQVLVCGGGIYGGIFNGIRRYRKLRRRFPDKTFIFFAIGVCPAGDRTMEVIRRNNFSDGPAELFYFEGGMDRDKLDPSKNTLLICSNAMLQRRGSLSEEESLCVQRLNCCGDYTDRESIAPLVERLKGV